MFLLLCSNGSSDKEPSPVDSFAALSAAECASTWCIDGVNLKFVQWLTKVKDVSLQSCSKLSVLTFLLEDTTLNVTERFVITSLNTFLSHFPSPWIISGIQSTKT